MSNNLVQNTNSLKTGRCSIPKTVHSTSRLSAEPRKLRVLDRMDACVVRPMDIPEDIMCQDHDVLEKLAE